MITFNEFLKLKEGAIPTPMGIIGEITGNEKLEIFQKILDNVPEEKKELIYNGLQFAYNAYVTDQNKEHILKFVNDTISQHKQPTEKQIDLINFPDAYFK